MQDQDKLLLLFEAVQQVGVASGAMMDALRRGLQAFAQTPVSARAARQWAERLRQQAPHFFPQRAAASAALVPDPRQARRPQPVALTPDQAKALQDLPPTQRLTQYRVLQERARTGAPQ